MTAEQYCNLAISLLTTQIFLSVGSDSSVVKPGVLVREAWISIPGPFKSAQCRQRLATAATLVWNCVALTLSRGDGSRISLHISAY